MERGVCVSQAGRDHRAGASGAFGDCEAGWRRPYPDTNRGRGFKLYPLWQTPFNGAGTLLPTLRISLVVAAWCC
jgi:hypothetical protein